MVSDDGTINLREDRDGDAEFHINQIEDNERDLVGNIEAVSMNAQEVEALKPHNKVKVKFDKFVNLVATHAYEEIFHKHMDEDVIITTDLLTDLANAHEEKQDRKMPLIFLIGIVLGVALTYLLLKT